MTTTDFPKAFFVTGTDTGIGKTIVSAMLARGLNATYWKPIQSGLEEETDTECVQRLAELSPDRVIPERYRLTEPLSPHASAELDGVAISLDDFALPEYSSKHLIVEGAGGLLVPINDRHMIIDLIQYLKLPVLLVTRSELGTLNHTFMSLEALRSRGIPVMGAIMNGPRNESNRQAIEKYGKVEIIGELEPLEKVTGENLKANFQMIFSQ
jgi:dethiobiotin synthetase